MILENNTTRYLRLLAELKEHREKETEILDKMDLIWQAMSMDERASVRQADPTWPPPPPPATRKRNKK